MKCPQCAQAEMQPVVERVHYTESGLDNVYVDGARVWRCPACGEDARQVPGVVNQALARHLIRQPRPLAGPEIRFLRQMLQLKGFQMADLAGVTRAVWSDWENGKRIPKGSMDRLIRLLYGGLAGIGTKQVIEGFTRETDPGSVDLVVTVEGDSARVTEQHQDRAA